jgi:SAM-dependent methyltransferase
VGTPANDLTAWIPRLLATWRAARPGPRRGGPRPPPDALLPDELREVAAAVTRLSTGLTRERELAGARYLDDERLLGAYLLFYWPISYLQARGVLSELPRRPRRVLDLGSGPGPLAFAALDAGAAEVTACDRAKQALSAARELARVSGQPLSTQTWNPAQGQPLAALTGGRPPDRPAGRPGPWRRADRWW